jgi:hypothetical protein
MKSYETLHAVARKNIVFHNKINGMGVVQGELKSVIGGKGPKLPPRPDQRTFQWKVRQAVARVCQARWQGVIRWRRGWEIRQRLPGRARTRLPRQARADLTRVKSAKKRLGRRVRRGSAPT